MADFRNRAATLLYRWRYTLIAYVAGGISAGVIAGVGALAVVQFGLFDTTATTPHIALVSWAAHADFTNHTRRGAASTPNPPRFTREQVLAGFRQYEADCVMCHGGPGVSRAHWLRGVVPTPPFLLDAAYNWTPAQLDYILEHGVKMSAMPSWGETRTHEQIWNIVAFLEALPNTSPAEFARLEREMPPPNPATGTEQVLPPPLR